MPARPIYLERLLIAAERKCTACDLARALDVSVAHAQNLLRYWEQHGMIAPEISAKRRHEATRGRRTARFRLTVKGLTTLRQLRVGAGYAGVADLAAVLRAPLSPRV